MNPTLIKKRLRRAGRRSLSIIPVLAIIGFAVIGALWIVFPFDKAPLYAIPTSTRWCDRDGIPMRIRLANGGYDSMPIYIYQDHDWIAKAIVAAEDQRFWNHHGVDPLAVARSCRQTATSMRRVSGASTLSMQVIRLSCPRSRNLTSKAIEAFRALQMERQSTKQEIISLYLNRAPFGANIVGIEAASRRYFAKGARDLSLGEAALLAGIPQSPTRFNPIKHPEAARKRQSYVLTRMVACSLISADQMKYAQEQPLIYKKQHYPFLAPHFCDMISTKVGETGVEIKTTLDLGLQRTVEESLAKYTPTLQEKGIHGMAAVVMHVKTGEILAMVGSPNFRAPIKGAQVNAAMAPRSAGSTLKPFVYALALDRGMITPLRVLYDIPQHYSDYDPSNFDKKYCGIISVRDALIQSLNLPAIDVEQKIGQPYFFGKLKELGLHSLADQPDRYGLGLVLGNAEVTLLDLTNSYACLARGGMHMPYATHLSDPHPSSRILSSEAAWLISDMMSGDERAMDSSGTIADIRIPRLAWKTGTSSGFRDGWTIAYNPDYVIGVWLGNPDGKPSPFLVGKKSAAPIVWDLCRRLYPGGTGPWFTMPESIESREVCALSGESPTAHCSHKIMDHAIKNVSRYETCEVHMLGREPVWPAAVAAFLNTRQQADHNTPIHDLVITSPANGSRYLYLPDASHAREQRIPLAANSSNSNEDLHWFVNDTYLGTSKSGSTLFWPMRKGTHHLVCSDTKGHSRSIKISVN